MPRDDLPSVEALAQTTRRATQISARAERPEIILTGGELPRIVDEAEAALIASPSNDFFQRGIFIVRPAVVAVPAADARKVLARRLVRVTVQHMVERLSKAAVFVRLDQRSGNLVPVDCPTRIAETLLAREGLWRLPVLAGILSAPTLRADGSILDKPGYDVSTGLLYDPQGVEFPAVSPRPDKREARAALDVLIGLIATFPFAGDGTKESADRSVALSGMLTATVRRSIRTAPLHGYDSPVAGSGKSMLVDLASVLADGRPAAVVAQGKTEEEMEKRLGAALLASDTIVSLDNCEHPLGGELLCQMLTQESVKIRILGKSINVELPSNAFVTATGNNLAVIGDMTRRALLCRLDPACERPEQRSFADNPVQKAIDGRPRYVHAALTILRAYHIAGKPSQAVPLGSFEEWSRWVRDALIWLGEPDPVETIDRLREADPVITKLKGVLAQWHTVFGTSETTTKDLIKVANERSGPGQEPLHPDFLDALLNVAGDKGAINSRMLGKWVAKNHGRRVTVEGEPRRVLRIERRGEYQGSAKWVMVEERP